jgi:hypothetical protein
MISPDIAALALAVYRAGRYRQSLAVSPIARMPPASPVIGEKRGRPREAIELIADRRQQRLIVAAIHALFGLSHLVLRGSVLSVSKTWMPGSSPGKACLS